jgi:hypothetical protein
MFDQSVLNAIGFIVRARIFLVWWYFSLLRRSIRYRSGFVRNSLLPQTESSWEALISSEGQPGFEESFRQCTGLSRSGFNYILGLFRNHEYWQNPKRYGKSIQPEKHLGITLWFMKTSGHQFEIQAVFGLTKSPVSRYISKGLEILCEILHKDSYSIVKWPNHSQKLLFARMIAQKRPILNDSGIWGFVDGFRMPMDKFGDSDEQNAYYNLKYSHNVGNIIVGTPDGCICWAALNLPGSWHDSKMSGNLYEKLKKDQPNGCDFKIAADTAFRSLGGRIVRTKKWNRSLRHKAIAGIRVAAEWNVRTIAGTWRRLKKNLGVNYTRNALILRLAIYLTNFRSRFDRVGQTKSWFEQNNPFERV